jgi:hypothetical protein
MKICQQHWNTLRAKIEASPYAWMISSSRAEAVERAAKDIEDKLEPQNFDPLMACNIIVWTHAIKVGGLRMMQYDGCPICKLPVPNWIDLAVAEALSQAEAKVAEIKKAKGE